MSCISCKGRGLCGRPVCPTLRRMEEMAALPKVGTHLEGLTPPEMFVGRAGYPLVRAGPMLPVGESLEMPSLGMDIGDIIALRSSMVRSEAKVLVKEAEAPGKLLETCQEIAMSSMPVEMEISFLRPPTGTLQFDGILSPSGPSGELQKMEIITNPVVPRKVDSVVDDRDEGAAIAAKELYCAGIGMEHISRLLSLGLMGKRRKLVPTRWSITASDDMVGNALKESILDRPLISDYYLYSGEDLGNHFEILLMPRSFFFELIEIWMPRSAWTAEGFMGSDFESERPKKKYSSLAGGYYAARLAAEEHLSRLGRQAAILSVREISESYWAPLGVWVVREVARKAMRDSPRRFETLDEALSEMGRRIKTPADRWRPISKLLAGPVQKSLAEF